MKFVGRPSKYGNRHKITEEMSRDEAVLRHKEEMLVKLETDPGYLEPLRGHDLADYCKLNEACHVDTLIMLANRPRRV